MKNTTGTTNVKTFTSIYYIFKVKTFVISVSSEDININLSSYHPDENEHLTFSDNYILSKSQVKINIDNVEDDVGFFVIHVHTFVENVTLSESPVLEIYSYVTGTNIGLVWAKDSGKAIFYLLRNIKVNETVKILLVINIHNENGKTSKYFMWNFQKLKLVLVSVFINHKFWS